ncbi:DUF5074 domain-containing protein [uncultured Lutibacter sp.]|uniref:YncE family protein n=1 Tax=uncultured Lutibacter sp. TaxID=437739 RepID=UPI00261D477A|nr:DUF5074 domain-containing protein [uncultured Lutibacter sp.]
MKISKFLLSIFLLSVIFVSCTNDDDDVQEPKGAYENGILISGEGGPSGSIYYVSNDFSTTESLIYKKVNNNDLGVYLQSMAFDNENAYIVVDNQNTITVVNRYTFEKVGEITTDLKKPRYMAIAGDKGYVTNWAEGAYGADVDDDYIAVVDLNTLQVTGTISVSIGIERIVETNGKLFVSHKGGNGTNNIVSVIDIATENVTEITVHDLPDDLLIDNSGNLVVLCEGKAAWSGNETPASIVKINTTTNSISSEIEFAAGIHPSALVATSSNLYYNIGSKVYEVSQSATTLPTSEFLDSAVTTFYGMAVNNNELFVLDAKDYASESDVKVFDMASKVNTQTFSGPINGSKIYFN